MAKVGLNFGDKLQIVDKKYRVITEALNLPEVFGKWSFHTMEGADLIYAEDTSQPRNQDGTYPEIPTGEVRGINLGILSSTQKETLFVTIVDMSESDIQELDLKYRDEVILEDLVVTYSSVGNNGYKLFASKIRKKAGNAPQQSSSPKGNEDKGQSKENK